MEVWIVHHLQVIGEAAGALSAELREQYPQVPWQKIIRMRHVLVHHYFGVDVDLVWLVVEHDLPDLAAIVDAMLQALPDEP
ncbi:MAG TPA: HepT-like ribonuclease domain-containing protein [Armatimonadota bacterium]